MVTDAHLLEYRRRKGDRLEQPRPVEHQFRFASSSAAERFATASRGEGFLVSASTTTAESVLVTVGNVHPLAEPDGGLHSSFLVIRGLALADGATVLDWAAPSTRAGRLDSIVSIVRRVSLRRRIRPR